MRLNTCSRPEGLPSVSVRAALFIFLLAFAVRLGMVLVAEFHKTPTRYEVQQIAESVVTTGVFGNPYLEPTGPTAHNAPGYPLILAGVYRLFGLGQTGEFASLVLNIFVWALVYALLPVASVELGLSAAAGIIAGVASALLPIHYRIELFNGEMPFTALLSLILTVAFVRLWRRRRLSPWDGLLLGLLNGLTLLVSPNLATFAAALLVVTVALNVRSHRAELLFSLAFIAATLIVLAPWAVRNQRMLGRPILLRSNLGLELQISNNAMAKVTKVDNQNLSMARYHPFLNREQAQRVREIGEVAYNQEKMAAALDWIRENPRDFVRLTTQRILWFWFPQKGRLVQNLLIWATTLLAFYGFYLTCRQSHYGAMAIAAIWLAYPPIYYLVQADSRYRVPINWTVFLMCSCALTQRPLRKWFNIDGGPGDAGRVPPCNK